MTSLALVLNIAISAASLARGFSSVGLNTLAAWVVFFALIWLLAVQQNWDWVSSAGLLLAILAAAFGLMIKLSPGWMFAGGLFALFAWDLNDFRARMRMVVKDENARRTERRHIARTTLLAFAGLGLASTAMFFIRAEFTPDWIGLLTVTLLLGLIQVAGQFRKS